MAGTRVPGDVQKEFAAGTQQGHQNLLGIENAGGRAVARHRGIARPPGHEAPEGLHRSGGSRWQQPKVVDPGVGIQQGRVGAVRRPQRCQPRAGKGGTHLVRRPPRVVQFGVGRRAQQQDGLD